MSLTVPTRNSVLTLSSSNLKAFEKIEAQLLESKKKDGQLLDKSSSSSQMITVTKSELLIALIIADFWNNLTIVALPAIVTNFVWRLMNLYGVAVSHNFWQIIAETIWEIATVIFVICFIIDALRQMYLWRKQQPLDKNNYSHIIKLYYENNGLKSSFNLAFKLYFACIFLTIGYEVIANDHQIYIDKSKTDEAIYRAFGGGIGAMIGLILASEILVIVEYFVSIYLKSIANTERKQFWHCVDQRSIYGVGIKGFCQGFMWSILADADLYIIAGNDDGAKILDSLIVAIVASICFAIGGIYTSLLGYCYRYSYESTYSRTKTDTRLFNDESFIVNSNNEESDISDVDGDNQLQREYQALL